MYNEINTVSLDGAPKVPQGINEVSYRVTINERPKVKAYSFKKMSVSNWLSLLGDTRCVHTA